MILTVGNTKGGVGKTTLALNIAIARALAGRDVWFIDGDRQGTGQIALTIRAENGVLPLSWSTRQRTRRQARKFNALLISFKY